jgi:hypothetical protein
LDWVVYNKKDMNIIIKNLLILGIFAISLHYTYAAKLYIESPKTVSSNREPLTVMVLLDSEEDIVSGLSGDFSFSSDMFDVGSISTQNSIVSLWANSPRVSQDKFFDQKTHITFEGAVLGGFGGLRNPYTSKVFPGIVFTITLIPKQMGVDLLTLDSIELHSYDSEGTILPSKKNSTRIIVPRLTGEPRAQESPRKVGNTTVTLDVYKDDLVSNSAPYLFIHDSDSSRSIDKVFIVESREYDPEQILSSSWKQVTNPYVFTHTIGAKYVHVKIHYTNNTYTYALLPPVENSQLFSHSSRILVYILLVVSLVYFYGKKFLYKNSRPL